MSYRSLIILNLFSVHLLFSILFLRPLRAVSAIWDIWWLSLPGNYFFLSLVIVGLWAHLWWGFICGTLIKPGCKPVPPWSRENLQFLPLSACQGITHTLVQGFWNQGCTVKCNLQQKQGAHLRSWILKGDHPRPSWDRHAISLVDVWIFSKSPLSLRVKRSWLSAGVWIPTREGMRASSPVSLSYQNPSPWLADQLTPSFLLPRQKSQHQPALILLFFSFLFVFD